LRQRGYNQAALLARALARATRTPVSEETLARVRNTKSQMRLNAEARRHNVSNAFHCQDERVSGRRVLVIDDVCTTGATLEACADALYAAGAAGVQALTLARTP
jgi:ComF family protein